MEMVTFRFVFNFMSSRQKGQGDSSLIKKRSLGGMVRTLKFHADFTPGSKDARFEFTAATVVRVSQGVPFSLPKLPGCSHVPSVLAYVCPV